MEKHEPVIVIEDDVWTRLIGVVLDPSTSQERLTAFADFMSPDLDDFRGWCDRIRQSTPTIFPSDVKLVSSSDLCRNLASAEAIVVESLKVGEAELALAPKLKVVYKYGVVLRNIDVAACQARGVKLLSVRRRANISCAEHALTLMLMLARRTEDLSGLISVEQLRDIGREYAPFDSRHTPGANWARFSGMRTLNGSTVGIIGLGEIGRELALRTAAFGVKTLYSQRTRLSDEDESSLGVQYRPLERLLAESDWIIPQLPLNASTLHFIDRERLALMKDGVCIVSVSRAELIERQALLEALRSGHVGGFALDSQYEEPGRSDDELLSFQNVILTPHMAGSPRFNGLNDIEEVIRGLARALA